MYTLVNLDYEAYLFDSHYHENADQFVRAVKEFEHVFFLFAKKTDSMIIYNEYSNEDLLHYEKLGFEIPKLTPKTRINKNLPINYWWGKKHELELEKFLNSKLTSIMIAKKLHLGFYQGAVVNSYPEFLTHLDKHPEITEWVLKNPYGMSGRGHYLFSTDKQSNKKIPEHIVKSRTILEPLYKRVLDLGTTFVVEEGKIVDQFMVINFNDHIGQFKGAGTSLNQKAIGLFLEKAFGISFDLIQSQLQQIANEYLQHRPENNIQIDSFFYLDQNNKFQFYPLVEVNCRKTMGLVVYQLAKRHPEAWCEWRFEEEQKIANENEIESFRLSPQNVKTQTTVKYFKDVLRYLDSDKPDGLFFRHN